jgi:hypothetical protein
VIVEIPQPRRGAVLEITQGRRMNTPLSFKQRTRKLALISALALSGATISAYSFAAQVTATADATVIAPIAIANTIPLSFGKFAPGAALGTVIVSTSGTRTKTGAVILSSIGPTISAAKFDVTGDANATYSISHTGTTTLTNTTGVGAETMALTKFSDLLAANATSGDATTGTLSASGTQSIYVGGTLAVAAAQVAGVYTGTAIVTVEYN